MGLLDKLQKVLGFRRRATFGSVDLEAFQEILGYHFRDESLLLLSLTHRSFTRFDPTHSPSNERLEFLGDSVLGLVIADQLFRDNPDVREGNLTKIKAMLVSETTLATVGKQIGLDRFLRLSPEEEKMGGRNRYSIVSDAFESVIAAVYIDAGLDAARDVILRMIYSRKDSILSDSSQRNCKGELLELVQGQGQGMPRYDVISTEGPDHKKVFTVRVHVNGREVGMGTGSSKKEAEQDAAAAALERFEKSSSQ